MLQLSSRVNYSAVKCMKLCVSPCNSANLPHQDCRGVMWLTVVTCCKILIGAWTYVTSLFYKWVSPTSNQWEEQKQNKKYANLSHEISKSFDRKCSRRAMLITDNQILIAVFADFTEIKCRCSMFTKGFQNKRCCGESLPVICCSYLCSREMKRWKFRVQSRAWTTLEHHIKARERLSKNSMQISLCGCIYLTEINGAALVEFYRNTC